MVADTRTGLGISTGFKIGDERKIKKLINEHKHDLIQAWERYFSR